MGWVAHANYLACRDGFDAPVHGRPGRQRQWTNLRPACRLALRTRFTKRHIRREKAANICTAQVLPALIAGMYAVCHGLKASSALPGAWHATAILKAGLQQLGYCAFHQAAPSTPCA